MGSHNTNYIIIRSLPQISGRPDHRPVCPGKTNQKSNGFLILPGRQIMPVNAFICRALHPQCGEFKGSRLRQYITDSGSVKINALRPSQHIINSVHTVFIQGKPCICYRFIVKNGQRIDNILISAFIMYRLPRKHLGKPVFLVHLLHQLQPEFLIARKPYFLAKTHYRSLAGKRSPGQFHGRHSWYFIGIRQYILRHLFFMAGKIFSLFQFLNQHILLLPGCVLCSLSETSFPLLHSFHPLKVHRGNGHHSPCQKNNYAY